MKKRKREPAISKIYVAERHVRPKDYYDCELTLVGSAYVTERAGLVSEVDTGEDTELHYLQNCEGWQWDAFLVYCKAKGLEIKTLTQHLRGE